MYSRHYGRGGQDGATRIDMYYSWGEVRLMEDKYQSVAFSDHLGYIEEHTLKSVGIVGWHPRFRFGTLAAPGLGPSSQLLELVEKL